jgi:hypothetical protein
MYTYEVQQHLRGTSTPLRYIYTYQVLYSYSLRYSYTIEVQPNLQEHLHMYTRVRRFRKKIVFASKRNEAKRDPFRMRFARSREK